MELVYLALTPLLVFSIHLITLVLVVGTSYYIYKNDKDLKAVLILLLSVICIYCLVNYNIELIIKFLS